MQLTFEQEQIIAYSALSEPGDALAQLIFQLRGPAAIEEYRRGLAKSIWIEQIAELAPEYLQSVPALLERFSLRLPKIHVPTLVERAIRWNASPVFPPAMPQTWSRFQDLGLHRPYLLWIAGNPEILERDGNAVVGTRAPSARGIARARALVRQLGSPVISGGASGIDACAHRAALDFSLPTVAFMAGGIDRAYPQENWPLFHDIVRAGGALVSELVPFTAPTRFRFLARNRLIAASATATFVVEAGYRSGSKNTANHAKNLGREVYAIPTGWSEKTAQGCNVMIREGLAQPWQLGRRIEVEPTYPQKRVLDAVREGANSAAEIAAESGLSITEVKAEIRALELNGISVFGAGKSLGERLSA